MICMGMKMKLPKEFCDRMKELLGKEYEQFIASYEEERAYGLRYNPLIFSSKEEFEERVKQWANLDLKPVSWCEEGFYYLPEQQPGRHPWHEGGAYYIQEPSAMSAVELLGVQPGERICDLCGAPGGKTTQIAGKLQGTGLLVTNEFYTSRAKVLSQNVERMGIPNAVVLNEETKHLAQEFIEFFDRVLVDAPCSGEGMFRKEQEATEQWSEENVELCAKRQGQILEDAACMLKSGGVLVYSTCTFSPQENEMCVNRFLQEHREFSILPDDRAQKEFDSARVDWVGGTSKVNVEDTYRLWPHKLKGEGHYIARLVKHGLEEGRRTEPKKETRRRKFVKSNVKEGELKDYREFEKKVLKVHLDEKIEGEFVLFGDQLYLVPKEMLDLRGWKLERAGLHLGTRKKNRFEPSHALAMYLKQDEVKQWVPCDEPLKYLHGETISCDFEQRGWTLVCVNGISVGWGKAQNGIVKNHYPKGLRICY